MWHEKAYTLPAKAGTTSVHSFTHVYMPSADIDGAPLCAGTRVDNKVGQVPSSWGAESSGGE